MHTDPWELGTDGGSFGLYRLIMYLESHDNDTNALELVPRSHLQRGCGKPCYMERPSRGMASAIHLHPRIGDAILFDQRLIHRGRGSSQAVPGAVSSTRITVQLSFGVANAISREWEAGDRERKERLLRSKQPGRL